MARPARGTAAALVVSGAVLVSVVAVPASPATARPPHFNAMPENVVSFSPVRTSSFNAPLSRSCMGAYSWSTCPVTRLPR